MMWAKELPNGSNKGEEHESHGDTRFSPEIEDQTSLFVGNSFMLLSIRVSGCLDQLEIHCRDIP